MQRVSISATPKVVRALLCAGFALLAAITSHAAQPQTITWSPLPAIYMGEGPYTLLATASSGLPIRYDDGAGFGGAGIVTGNSFTPTQEGALDIDAFQDGDANYQPAFASISITVLPERSEQTLTFSPFTVSGTTASLSASSTSGLPVTFSVVSGPGSVSGNTLTVTGGGTIIVAANQSGNNAWRPASQVTRTVNVVGFTIPAKVFGDAPFALAPNYPGGSSPTFSIVSQTPNDGTGAGMISLAGDTVTISKAGSAVIRVTYSDGATTTAPLAVARATPTLTWNTAFQTSYKFSDSAVTLSATANSGEAVSYSKVGSASWLSLSAGVMSFAEPLSGDVGQVKVSKALSPNYEAAELNSPTFTIEKGTQTITFPVLSASSSTLNLGATASSGLPVTYTVVSGPANVSGNTLTILGPGPIVVSADQAGNVNYEPAPTVSRSVAIVEFSIAAKTFGDAPFSLTSNYPTTAPVYAVLSESPNDGSGAGMVTISGDVLTILKAGTAQIRVTYPADGGFESATAIAILNVAKLLPVHIWPSAGPFTFGDPPFVYAATSSATNPLTHSIESGPANISGTTVTIVGAGDIVVRALQPADGNHIEQSSISPTITVNKAPVTLAFANQNLTGNTTLSAAHLGATATSPASVAPTGDITYEVIAASGANASPTSGPIAVGTMLTWGTYTIRANYPGDANYLTGAINATFTITAPVPAITTDSSFTAVVGSLFSFQPSAANSPTSWTAQDLPAGLSIHSASGLISGVPTAAGSHSSTLTASNSSGTSLPQTITFTILAPLFTTTDTITARQNAPFAFSVAGNNPSGVSFGSTGLPAGLILSSNGQITGTPTAFGSSSLTVTATYAGGSQTRTFTLDVIRTFVLSVSANPAAGGSISGAGLYDIGSSAEIIATPNAGYRFSSWTGPDAASLDSTAYATAHITMNSAKSVTANFVPVGTLTVAANAGGTTTGSGTYDIGQTIAISAIPDSGYYFTGWTGTVGNPSSASTTVQINSSSHVVTANFAPLGDVASSGTIQFAAAIVPGSPNYAPTTTTKTATITNTGTAPLTLSSVTTTGDFFVSLSTPTVIAVGNSIALPVTFSPRTRGLHNGTITFVNNDTVRPVIQYNLQGYGASGPVVPPTVAGVRLGSGQLATGQNLTFRVTGESTTGILTRVGAIVIDPDGNQAGPTFYAPGGESGQIVHDYAVLLSGRAGTYTVQVYAEDSIGQTTGWIVAFSVNVIPGTYQRTLNSYAVPAPGMEIWFTPSAINSATINVQRP